MSGPVGLYLRLLCLFLFCPLLSPIFNFFPPPCSPASRSVSSLRFSGWIRGLSWRPVQWPYPSEARVRFSPLQQHRVGKESVVGGPWAGGGGGGGRSRRRRQKHNRSRPTAGGAIEQWRWWRKEKRRWWHSGGRPTVREGWKGKCFGPQKSVSTGRLEIAWWSGEKGRERARERLDRQSGAEGCLGMV